MEESAVVLERLARIDALARAGAAAPAVLAELRGLVRDVEASTERIGRERAAEAETSVEAGDGRAPIDHY